MYRFREKRKKQRGREMEAKPTWGWTRERTLGGEREAPRWGKQWGV